MTTSGPLHRMMSPSSLAPGASHEENCPHLRPHLRPHHLRPYVRLASPRRQDRLRPQHGPRLHHHGGVVPANLLRHPQLPRQHPRRPNLLRPRFRLRYPDHLITTVCYVAMWEVLYFNFMPHFMDRYFAAQIHKVQSSGLDPATTAAQVAAIQRSQQLYRSYRDNTLAGQISFGRAFGCGLLITKTPSSTWPTPSWSPCPSALSLLSSPLPSSAAKASVEPTAALAVMTT